MSEKVTITEDLRTVMETIFNCNVLKGENFVKATVDEINTSQFNLLSGVVIAQNYKVNIKRSGKGVTIILSDGVKFLGPQTTGEFQFADGTVSEGKFIPKD